jgi:hypothetical protein
MVMMTIFPGSSKLNADLQDVDPRDVDPGDVDSGGKT